MGAQSTVLAGGRYDGLVKALGGADSGGVGWSAAATARQSGADCDVGTSRAITGQAALTASRGGDWCPVPISSHVAWCVSFIAALLTLGK